MSKHTLLCFGVSLLTLSTACGNRAQTPAALSVEEQLARIDSLERAVFPNGPINGTDTARAHPFVRAVERFAEANPQHPRTPELLMDAAGIANGTEWSNKSVQLWGLVWRNAPDFERAPEAMFYQGFVLDTKFGQYDLAANYYERLTRDYPESPFAEQAAGLRRIATGEQALPPVPDGPAEVPTPRK